MQDVLNTYNGSLFDEDLQYLDFMKIENFKLLSLLYKALGRG
jgi:hypothetical protein